MVSVLDVRRHASTIFGVTSPRRNPKLLIAWDVDSTLIKMGVDAFTVFDMTVREMFGPNAWTPTKEYRERYHGTTDLFIAADYVEKNLRLMEQRASAESGVPMGVPTGITMATAAHLRSFFPVYLRLMSGLQETLKQQGTALPGVNQLIKAFNERGAVQTLVTGNHPQAAQMKLDTFGITTGPNGIDLAVGGYGSRSRHRPALVPMAVEAVRARYGPEFGSNLVLIGDTKLDFAAAHENGARFVGVATGSTSSASLREAGAQIVVETLEEQATILTALGFSLSPPELGGESAAMFRA